MRRRVGMIWMIAIIALAGPATADESEIPRLGEHQFVPVTVLTEPFVVTIVQTNIGLGWTVNSAVPLFSSDSTLIGSVGANQLLAGIGFISKG